MVVNAETSDATVEFGSRLHIHDSDGCRRKAAATGRECAVVRNVPEVVVEVLDLGAPIRGKHPFTAHTCRPPEPRGRCSAKSRSTRRNTVPRELRAIIVCLCDRCAGLDAAISGASGSVKKERWRRQDAKAATNRPQIVEGSSADNLGVYDLRCASERERSNNVVEDVCSVLMSEAVYVCLKASDPSSTKLPVIADLAAANEATIISERDRASRGGGRVCCKRSGAGTPDRPDRQTKRVDRMVIVPSTAGIETNVKASPRHHRRDRRWRRLERHVGCKGQSCSGNRDSGSNHSNFHGNYSGILNAGLQFQPHPE